MNDLGKRDHDPALRKAMGTRLLGLAMQSSLAHAGQFDADLVHDPKRATNLASISAAGRSVGFLPSAVSAKAEQQRRHDDILQRVAADTAADGLCPSDTGRSASSTSPLQPAAKAMRTGPSRPKTA